MTLSFLRRRIQRVLTRPPEILYALTHHWFLVVVCLVVGTAAMWVRVVSAPLVYQGRAQLLVRQSDPLLPSLTEREQRAWRERDMTSFLASQSAILQSDDVLRKLLLCSGRSLASEGAPATPGQDGPSAAAMVQSAIHTVQQTASDWLGFQKPPPMGTEDERAMQMAIDDFQSRSAIEPEPLSNTIDLLIYGEDRAALEWQLRCWIEAYKSHLAEMVKGTWASFLSDRGKSYKASREAALRELVAFEKENPDVSNAEKEMLDGQIMHLQLELIELRRRVSEQTTLPHTLRVDPEYEALVTQKTSLELERESLIATGYSPDSAQVKSIDKRIAWARKKLSGFDPIGRADGDDWSLPAWVKAMAEEQKAHQQKLEDLTLDKSRELRELQTRRSRVSDKLEEHERLVKRFETASENFDRFETMRLESLDLLDSPLNVQVSDEPAVGTEPYSHHPLLKLSVGSLLGLFLGVGLAIFREVMCSRVRFKHDLIDDFALPVVGVLPR